MPLSYVRACMYMYMYIYIHVTSPRRNNKKTTIPSLALRARIFEHLYLPVYHQYVVVSFVSVACPCPYAYK